MTHYNKLHQLLGRLSILLLVFGLYFSIPSTVLAAGNTIYVSTSGSDSNSGSVSAPVRSFVKAQTLVSAGDIILVEAGTYTENLKVTTSGAAGSPLSIRANGNVVIDGQDVRSLLIEVPLATSYVTIEGFEVKNSIGIGVLISGSNVIVDNVTAHDTQSMGIQVEGTVNTVKNSEVYRAALSNESRNASAWGSGLKCRVGGDSIVLENNTVYQNYGEGIAITRCSNVQVKGNHTYDNFAVNIYIDNSYDVTVEKNFVTCSNSSGFEYLTGLRMSGIALAEEEYSGWGAQLARVIVKNNIVNSCNRGVIYFGADIAGGGLDTVTIANNTLWNIQSTAISIEQETAKTRNTQIVNNIAHNPTGQVAWIEDPTGITLSNNFWVRATAPSVDTNANGVGDRFGTDVQFVTSPGSTAASFKLSQTSPAKDGAKVISQVSDDFEGKVRGSSPDMGAFEAEDIVASPTPSPSPTPTPSPSPSPTPSPTPTPTPTPSPSPSPSPDPLCRSTRQDVNKDGTVNLLDYAAVLEGIKGVDATNPNLDVIEDSKLNLLDLADVIANLMRSCPQ